MVLNKDCSNQGEILKFDLCNQTLDWNTMWSELILPVLDV